MDNATKNEKTLVITVDGEEVATNVRLADVDVHVIESFTDWRSIMSLDIVADGMEPVPVWAPNLRGALHFCKHGPWKSLTLRVQTDATVVDEFCKTAREELERYITDVSRATNFKTNTRLREVLDVCEALEWAELDAFVTRELGAGARSESECHALITEVEAIIGEARTKLRQRLKEPIVLLESMPLGKPMLVVFLVAQVVMLMINPHPFAKGNETVKIWCRFAEFILITLLFLAWSFDCLGPGKRYGGYCVKLSIALRALDVEIADDMVCSDMESALIRDFDKLSKSKMFSPVTDPCGLGFYHESNDDALKTALVIYRLAKLRADPDVIETV